MVKFDEIAFPTSRNANKHALLTLGSDCIARDNVEMSRGGGQSTCSLCKFTSIHATKAIQHPMVRFDVGSEVLV